MSTVIEVRDLPTRLGEALASAAAGTRSFLPTAAHHGHGSSPCLLQNPACLGCIPGQFRWPPISTRLCLMHSGPADHESSDDPVKAVNHIGIAVRSIDAQRPFYEDCLGAVFEGTEVVADQKARVGFFHVG